MTRRITSLILILTLSFGFFTVFPRSADASFVLSGHRIIDTFVARIKQDGLQRGYTASLQNQEALFAFFPGTSQIPYSLRVDSIDLLPGGAAKAPKDHTHYGPIIELNHTLTPEQIQKDFVLKIRVNHQGRFFRMRMMKWSERYQKWTNIQNQLDPNHNIAIGLIREPGIYAVFESTKVEEGNGSWFRDSRPMIAAHNGYPMGTYVRVINVINKKSVVVKIVSRGPYVFNRVIDLGYDAFAAIASPSQGVIPVNVVPEGTVLGDSTPAPSPQSAPAQPQVGIKNADTSIRARSYVSMNADTGEFISANNGDKVYPLASLTKLMTALVVLDTKPDWSKLVTYEPDDNADGAKLYIQYGDKVNVRDLWHTMLVGSANNAAKMLRKSTGLSVEQFRDKMNAKAKALGLSTLYFFEPTGLDHKNVGSASDYARLARLAFQNETIRSVTVMKSYSFYTAGRNEFHNVTNQNNMIGSGWSLLGTKTGYTDEALYNLTAEVVGKTTGKKIISVTFGSPSDSIRYSDMDKALNAGFKPYL